MKPGNKACFSQSRASSLTRLCAWRWAGPARSQPACQDPALPWKKTSSDTARTLLPGRRGLPSRHLSETPSCVHRHRQLVSGPARPTFLHQGLGPWLWGKVPPRMLACQAMAAGHPCLPDWQLRLGPLPGRTVLPAPRSLGIPPPQWGTLLRPDSAPHWTEGPGLTGGGGGGETQ